MLYVQSISEYIQDINQKYIKVKQKVITVRTAPAFGFNRYKYAI